MNEFAASATNCHDEVAEFKKLRNRAPSTLGASEAEFKLSETKTTLLQTQNNYGKTTTMRLLRTAFFWKNDSKGAFIRLWISKRRRRVGWRSKRLGDVQRRSDSQRQVF